MSTPAIRISTEWAVHVQGMDDVMPTLGRRDAFKRAHKVNEGALWSETHQSAPCRDDLRPVVWAIPVQYGPGSSVGETCGYPEDWTSEQVEAAWKEWGGE